jgi:heat shock protein HslJ
MKTMKKVLTYTFVLLLFASCKTKSDTHTSMNSLDWDGTYTGKLSTKDCPEAESVIILNSDMTYKMSTTCNGNVMESFGKLTWNKSGYAVTLTDNITKQKMTFKVGENNLQSTDSNDMLRKVMKDNITEKYWKLIELSGNPIERNEDSPKEAHVIFKTENNRINGSSGCNSFSGSYELGPETKVRISDVVSTRMMCPNIETENGLFEAFKNADNYTVSEDGNTLSLNRGRMAPLARFEVVYLR